MGPVKRAYVRAELYEKQGGACCYCGTLIFLPSHYSERKFPIRTKKGGILDKYRGTVEHLKRQVDGGKSSLDNLALACLPCNTKRGNTDWLTYKTQRMGEPA